MNVNDVKSTTVFDEEYNQLPRGGSSEPLDLTPTHYQ